MKADVMKEYRGRVNTAYQQIRILADFNGGANDLACLALLRSALRRGLDALELLARLRGLPAGRAREAWPKLLEAAEELVPLEKEAWPSGGTLGKAAPVLPPKVEEGGASD